ELPPELEFHVMRAERLLDVTGICAWPAQESADQAQGLRAAPASDAVPDHVRSNRCTGGRRQHDGPVRTASAGERARGHQCWNDGHRNAALIGEHPHEE